MTNADGDYKKKIRHSCYFWFFIGMFVAIIMIAAIFSYAIKKQHKKLLPKILQENEININGEKNWMTYTYVEKTTIDTKIYKK